MSEPQGPMPIGEAVECLRRLGERPAGGVFWSGRERAEAAVLAEVERLRAVEQRAIDVHTTGARDAVLSMAHYILTGETTDV